MRLCVYTTFCPSSFTLIMMGNKGLVAIIVLLVSFDYKCSMTFSHGSLGWSAVYD